MTPGKRIADILLALLLVLLLAPLGVAVALAIVLTDGRPIFYASTRARAPGRNFRLVKFRTMKVVAHDCGVSGGDKSHRISPTGAFLRRHRLDELPQLINILRGDMSFVGPRPPLPQYVEAYPTLYGKVLKSRPGVTGLATLAYHRTEERLLAACATPEETEAVYTRRCIPVKARLDLIYQQNRTLCYDGLLMAATVLRRLPLHLKARK
ncbi:MAG TPA: sugar transferase [Aliiroseovarius sp.]|nr:sugar transferase [Aliiroseovarius sp.]